MTTETKSKPVCCWSCGSLLLEPYLEGQRCKDCGATYAKGDERYQHSFASPERQKAPSTPPPARRTRRKWK